MGRPFHRTRGSQRSALTEDNTRREIARRERLQANPRTVVENILSRKLVVDEVARRMINKPDEGQEGAVDFVAARWGVPAETVRECISVEVLETGL